MKRIVTLIIGTALISSALPEKSRQSIPSLDRLEEIGLRHGIWAATFYPDGSARLGLDIHGKAMRRPSVYKKSLHTGGSGRANTRPKHAYAPLIKRF